MKQTLFSETSEKCMRCKKLLLRIDIGATKKFINRGSTEFFCLDCLSEDLKVPKELLLKKIELFKLQGCKLFEE